MLAVSWVSCERWGVQIIRMAWMINSHIVQTTNYKEFVEKSIPVTGRLDWGLQRRWKLGAGCLEQRFGG
jgi:hypothetical protein